MLKNTIKLTVILSMLCMGLIISCTNSDKTNEKKHLDVREASKSLNDTISTTKEFQIGRAHV